MQLNCPCHREPHFISTDAFLLLEEVEGAFGTTEQSEKLLAGGWATGDLLLAISSRMSRQKEIVDSIHVPRGSFYIKDRGSVEAFITLLKAKWVYIKDLDVDGKIREEGW